MLTKEEILSALNILKKSIIKRNELVSKKEALEERKQEEKQKRGRDFAELNEKRSEINDIRNAIIREFEAYDMFAPVIEDSNNEKLTTLYESYGYYGRSLHFSTAYQLEGADLDACIFCNEEQTKKLIETITEEKFEERMAKRMKKANKIQKVIIDTKERKRKLEEAYNSLPENNLRKRRKIQSAILACDKKIEKAENELKEYEEECNKVKKLCNEEVLSELRIVLNLFNIYKTKKSEFIEIRDKHRKHWDSQKANQSINLINQEMNEILSAENSLEKEEKEVLSLLSQSGESIELLKEIADDEQIDLETRKIASKALKNISINKR